MLTLVLVYNSALMQIIHLSPGQTTGLPTELILRVQNHAQQAYCPLVFKEICYFKLI